MPFYDFNKNPQINYIFTSSGGRTSFNMNSAYVHRTSGQAIAIRHQCKNLDPITEVYVMVEAFVGTAALGLLKAQIYNEDTSTNVRPGTTLRATASSVVLPTSGPKWAKFVFGTPYSPSTVGEVLFIVISSDAVAPTTDYAQILSATTTIHWASPAPNMLSTADGFATAGVALGEAPFMIKQGSHVWGKAYTAAAAWTSNTRKRGILVTPPCDLTICGAIFTATTSLSGIQIFDNVTGPGGTPLWSFALGSDANQSRDEVLGCKLWAPIQLTGGQTYKVVFTFSASTTVPVPWSIEDYATYPTECAEMVDNFHMCGSCIDDGAGGWTLFPERACQMSLIIDDYIPPAAGGILPNSNLRGNFQ